MSQWYGESNKIVAGLFGLARKRQPSIIFIDEIDSIFRERSRDDHEVTAMLKAQFMTYDILLVSFCQSCLTLIAAYGMVFFRAQIRF